MHKLAIMSLGLLMAAGLATMTVHTAHAQFAGFGLGIYSAGVTGGASSATTNDSILLGSLGSAGVIGASTSDASAAGGGVATLNPTNVAAEAVTATRSSSGIGAASIGNGLAFGTTNGGAQAGAMGGAFGTIGVGVGGVVLP